MNPNITIDIQHHAKFTDCPSDELITQWAQLALQLLGKDTEISISLIDFDEMSQLNETYRHKTGPTNVLAFPFEKPDDIELSLLGDLAICVPQMIIEAKTQHKPLNDHFAHLVIHGCLHLQGFDHLTKSDATHMEQLEIDLLKKLNIPNPYEERTL